MPRDDTGMTAKRNRTKIICTMGPSVNSYEQIVAMIQAGMNVARINFSHGTHEEHGQVIEMLKKARADLEVPLAIMLDTKGPEIRIGKFSSPQIELKPFDKWELTKEEIVGDATKATLIPPSVIDRIPVGANVLIDNGYLISKVVEKKESSIVVEIETGGVIKPGRGVNVPNYALHLPAITEQDIKDISFGCKQDIDLIAASFIRSADHVIRIKKLLAEEGKTAIQVFAKIENHEGIEHFDSILQAADGIMIARGDLGVEVPLFMVPRLQKMMIRKCYLAGKPVVTATQMLETMIEHSRPTRAETSDVANAIYDSTSAVMLSGETAVGKYPIKTIQVMKSIIEAAETDFDYHGFFDFHSELRYHDVPSSVTLATVKTAYSSHAKAFFVFTSTGATARLISRLRPEIPIVALTPHEKTYHQLAANWGVIPVHKSCKTLTEAFSETSSYCLRHGIVNYGDLVVVNAGTPFGVAGTTNMMIVESIGDVLVRGEGKGKTVHGNITFVPSPKSKKPYETRKQILVLTHCDDAFEPLVHEALGIILQNRMDDTDSENAVFKFAEQFNIPALIRADGATLVLKEGQLVTIDPDKGLIYKGVVL